MKTFKQVKEHIDILRVEINNARGTNGFKALNKEYNELIVLRNFLETNPNEIALQNQLNKLRERWQKIESKYSAWKRTSIIPFEKRTMAAYLKDCGAEKIKQQINFLENLLNEG